jgi:hypothetical protein
MDYSNTACHWPILFHLGSNSDVASDGMLRRPAPSQENAGGPGVVHCWPTAPRRPSDIA